MDFLIAPKTLRDRMLLISCPPYLLHTFCLGATFEAVVWRKAHQSVRAVYRVSRAFPRSETFGVSSQSRRAAGSIEATIAEGFKKRGKEDTLRFLNIAQGSLEESRSYLILAQDLDWGDGSELKTMAVEVSTLLEAYSQAALNSDF